MLAGLIAHPESPSRGTILLVPGFTGSKEDFIALMPYLAQFGYSVASYDHRGQYESPGPASSFGYAMDDFVDDALRVSADLMTHSDLPLHLVGHSFGGLVAQAVMRRHLKDLDAGDTERLFASLTLLASGPAAVPGELQVLAAQFVALLPATPLDTIWEHKESLDRANGWLPPSPEVHQFLRRRFTSNNPFALQAKAEILVRIHDGVDELSAAAQAVGLPILVAYGEDDDRWTPQEQEDMASRLGARRVRWPGIGHSPNAEQPEMCSAALAAYFADVANTSVATIEFPNGLRGYTEGMELREPVKHTAAGVSAARRTVVRQLEAWGMSNSIDDMQIIVSELVTNALRYGKDPIELRLRVFGNFLRIEVFDSNIVDVPRPRQATASESTGRGMPLIDALTSQWGVDVSTSRKVVWAHVPLVTD